MAVVNPPGWLQNVGAQNTAEIMRNSFGALQAAVRASGSGAMISRGGVNAALGDKLNVTQTGSPSMAVLVKSGQAMVPGTQNTKQGAYSVYNDADFSVSIAASDPTLPRIDIIVFKVEDTAYSGGVNASSIVAVTGTPASSPAPPSAPNNSITLAEIAVAANATTIVNANITDKRIYVAGAGGMISVKDAAERDAIANPYDSLAVWRRDEDTIDVYDGAAWSRPAGTGYRYHSTLYLTSNTSFVKASHAGGLVKAVIVEVQGAGGGGGGAAARASSSQASAGAGGGGGGYALKFILAGALSSSETVTIGAGGSGGAAGDNDGTAGGNTSFGAHATGNGGGGGGGGASSAGSITAIAGGGGGASSGNLHHNGSDGTHAICGTLGSTGICVQQGYGGASRMGANQNTGGSQSGANGVNGVIYGGGGSGGYDNGGGGSDRTGGNGADGIVVVHIYV